MKNAEVWKTHPRHSDFEISNKGRVCERASGKLRVIRNASPYPEVGIRSSAARRSTRVHVLVLETFVGPRPAGFVCNHKDGDKTNNAVSNLEWVTPGDNVRHAVETGLFDPTAGTLHGEDHGMARLTEDGVREIRARWLVGEPALHLSREFGVHPSTIDMVVKNKTWRNVVGCVLAVPDA